MKTKEKAELREFLEFSIKDNAEYDQLSPKVCEYLLKAIDHMENGKKLEDVNPFDLSDIARYNRKKQKP